MYALNDTRSPHGLSRAGLRYWRGYSFNRDRVAHDRDPFRALNAPAPVDGLYFLMVALDKSWIVPLTVMLVVPLSLIGIIPFLYHTGTALNVQSLLGIIFIVGIKVANTVLMTDYAHEIRRHRPDDAGRQGFRADELE